MVWIVRYSVVEMGMSPLTGVVSDEALCRLLVSGNPCYWVT